jgi:hypothetical protein
MNIKQKAGNWIYRQLLKRKWIEDPDEKIRQEFETILESFKMAYTIDHHHAYITVFSYEGIKIEWEKIAFGIYNPYLKGLSYLAYFGLREKNGEGFKEMPKRAVNLENSVMFKQKGEIIHYPTPKSLLDSIAIHIWTASDNDSKYIMFPFGIKQTGDLYETIDFENIPDDVMRIYDEYLPEGVTGIITKVEEGKVMMVLNKSKQTRRKPS